MAKYKVMVVGLGKRGGHHVTYFDKHELFEVTAICDIDEARIASVAETLNNPITGTDAATVAAEAKPDVFCFCTLPNIRKDLIQVAIDCGAKMVAFEKPVALTSEEGLEIQKMVADSGIKGVLSYQHRYGSHYQAVKDIVDSGAIGDIHHVYASAMGWPAHMMTHMLHYTRWFLDNPDAEWVMANGAGKNKLNSPDLHFSPDYVGGFVQFDNGVRGTYEVGGGAPDVPHVGKWFGKNRIGVHGTDGYAEVYTNGGWRAVTKDGVKSGEGVMDYDADMPGYIQDIADDLEGVKPHPCNFTNAFHNFEIWQAMYRSIIQRGQVALPLTSGLNEVEELRKLLPDDKLLVTIEESKKEFGC